MARQMIIYAVLGAALFGGLTFVLYGDRALIAPANLQPLLLTVVR